VEPRPNTPRFDAEKFKELMLYAAEKSTADPAFGAVKLNKILFFSDFLSFGLTGEAITGATYKKQINGPVPNQLKPIARQIANDKDGVFVKRPRFNRIQIRLVPMRPANRHRFSAEELDLIDEVINDLSGRNAAEVSQLSHDRSVAWQLAAIGEEIPYEAVFLSARPLTSIDIERGQQLARKHGWLSPAK
jgi:hypothetical protein